MSRTRVRRTDAQWLELLEQQRASGLTQQAFCERHGIVVGGLRSARRRLTKKERPGRVSTDSPFVEVAMPAQPSRQRWDVELCLGAGVVIRLRSH